MNQQQILLLNKMKKRIKGKQAYIKLILEKNEVVVCWSFHEDK